jgi:hypothetical protein
MFQDVRQSISRIVRGKKPGAEELVLVRAPMEQDRKIKSLMTVDLNSSPSGWTWGASLKGKALVMGCYSWGG